MVDKEFPRWSRIDVLEVFEYPQHAGLSLDGHLCFVAEYDNLEYLVWDTRSKKIIWRANSPDLSTWINGEYIEIDDESAKGRYRIFGLRYKHPLESVQSLGIALKLDEAKEQLILTNTSTGHIVQKLRYASSTDWA